MFLYYFRVILVIIVPFITFMLLGSWQVIRLKWKNSIIEKMQLHLTDLPKENLENYSYCNVSVKGVFNNKRLAYVFAGGRKYYFLQVMHLEDGRYILINRGFVLSTTNLDIENFVSSKPIDISGNLYCENNKKSGWFVNHDIKSNVWMWFDMKSIEKYLNLPIESCIIWANDKAAIKEITPNRALTVRNNHLEYVITWYSLAVIWILGCLYYFYSTKKNQNF